MKVVLVSVLLLLTSCAMNRKEFGLNELEKAHEYKIHMENLGNHVTKSSPKRQECYDGSYGYDWKYVVKYW